MKMFPQLARYWIAPVQTIRWNSLADVLSTISESTSDCIDVLEWDESPYHPVPSIIDAAMALRTGLDIREIAHSEASEHEIQTVRNTIQIFVNQARSNRQHAICFLTGVPGSGKTLVGLSLAHADEKRSNAIHFMSGNGPLVKVLQHLFTAESRRSGARAAEARTEAIALVGGGQEINDGEAGLEERGEGSLRKHERMGDLRIPIEYCQQGQGRG